VIPPIQLSCTLPVFAGPPGSGGFITFPSGSFTPDPKSGVTLPSGWSSSNVTVTSVKGWTGSGFGTCPGTDQGLELVTIQATSPDSMATETVDVVKRVAT